MINRVLAPEFRKVENIEFGKAEKSVLKNGIPLHIINAGTQAVIRLEFLIKAGSSYESKSGVSYFTSKILQEGTKNYTSRELSRMLDKFGAFLEVNPGMEYTTFVVHSLARHLPSILPVIQEILFQPSFPENELETIKTIKIQNTKVNQEKTSYLSSINFRKNIFGAHHPYGKELKEEDINNIDAEDLKAFYDSNFSNSWDMIISGQVTEREITAIDNFFGQHSVPENKPLPFLQPSTQLGRVMIKKEGSLQSSIRVGKLQFTMAHHDYPKLKIVNEILGGYFGSRLMKNIREEKGFTYGIHSSLVTLKQEGYFVIGTDVKKEFTKQTIDEIYKEINILRNEPLGYQELETVRNFMTGSFLSEINTPFALADKFKSVYLNGLNYDFYQNLINTINTITPDDVLQIADRYLQPDQMTEVIAGDL